MDVYLLWHVHEPHAEERDVKLIGVYSSQDLAEAAKKRLLSQPGFRDTPKGFQIDRYQVDQDYWIDGYVIVTHEDTVRAYDMMNE